MEIDPKYVPTYIHRGNAYMADGEVHRAIADFALQVSLARRLIASPRRSHRLPG
jgi:hypothetical protein